MRALPYQMSESGQGRLWSPVEGKAGLPSAPEVPCTPRQLRLVPKADLSVGSIS
jgi:hypothetical protein